MEEPISIRRDVEVVRIPSGEKILIPAGTAVIVTQALGGSYTVLITTQAGLFHLEGKDADALGVEQQQAPPEISSENLEEAIWAQLKTCFDPEIPVNIVDLGLIYSLDITPKGDGTHSVRVQMTLTAPGCGMGPTIAADAQNKVLSVPGVTEANVDLAWDPPWSPDRISEAGRQKLGMV